MIEVAPRFIGTMLSRNAGLYPDEAADRALAHRIFGTPLDRRTLFSEPHGFWWGVVGVFWPAANPIHVWLDEDAA